MVFSLTSKKKKNSKIPKLNSKLRLQNNSQRNVTVTNNLILTPRQSQNVTDPSVYQQLSSSRAIFETNKLESACGFLKCLKKKLERDVDADKGHAIFDNSTSETITDILDTLIDVSDNITPIISDASTKSIYRSSMSDSSSVSEKQFNRTMTATNKLLDIAKKPGVKSAAMADASYYFAHKIVANNLEELSMFKNNIKNVGDRIYVDKKLLAQLIELHGLLKDTITKLKGQEEMILTDRKVKEELDRSGPYQTATNWEVTPRPCRKPETSTPIAKSPPLFQLDETDISNDTGSQFLTATSPALCGDVRKWCKKKSKEADQVPVGATAVLTAMPASAEAEDASTAYATARETPGRSSAASSRYASALQTPQASSYATARQSPGKSSVEISGYTTAFATPSKMSPDATSYTTARQSPDRSAAESSGYVTTCSTPVKISSAPCSYPTTPENLDKTTFNVSSGPMAYSTPVKMSPGSSSYASASSKGAIGFSADETSILPSLPFDISSNGSARPLEESLYTASKMKKKAVKATNLEYATMLTTEVPSQYADYDSNVKIKEEEISVDNLTDEKQQRGLEQASTRALLGSIDSEPEQPEQEEMALQLAPSKTIVRQDYVLQEKTFKDTATEISTSRLYAPIRRSVVEAPRDTKDAACCGALKDIKSLGTSTTVENATTMSKASRKRLETMSRDDSVTMKNHRTQTPSKALSSFGNDSFADGEKLRGKTLCDCKGHRKPVDSSQYGHDTTENTMLGYGLSSEFEPIITSTQLEEGSLSKTTRSSNYPSQMYGSASGYNKNLPGYFEGIDKCIAELECMSNCLRHATLNKDEVHECIQIYPEAEIEFFINKLPHFHTVIDGVPMVVQFNKEGIPIDNSLRNPDIKCCRNKCLGTTVDKASTCCREGVLDAKEVKQPLPCRLWGSISKSAHEKCPAWVSCRRRKPILKPVSAGDGTRRRSIDTTVDDTKRKSFDPTVDDTRRKSMDTTAYDTRRRSMNTTVDDIRRKSMDTTVNDTRRRSFDTTVDDIKRKSMDTTVDDTRKKTMDTTAKTSKIDEHTSREEPQSLKGKPPFSTGYGTEDEESYTLRTRYISLSAMAPETSVSTPYVAAKESLPKIDDPDRVCSSLQFDVKSVPVTFKQSVLYHPDGVVNRALKNIDMLQLLDSFRPAKCCRKAVLNEKSRGPLPYAASLESLPLMENDLRTIKQIMHSNNIPALSETQTLYEHYINFQKNIIPRRNAPGRTVQVYIFEFLKREDDDKSHDPNASRSSSSHTLHDLRIFDFIKKIYTSDPLYDKISRKQPGKAREGGDKHARAEKKPRRQGKKKGSERRPVSRRSKCKKTETKSFYSSVESYSSLKSNRSNFLLNSSTSSVTSSKQSKSHNPNTMYSFLLLPKGEFNISTSNNDLSTSYAPSVNSLPFEDEMDSLDSPDSPDSPESTSSNCLVNNSTRASSDEGDDGQLSPKNYAKTLDGIYELDENGNMRIKGSTKDKPNNDRSIEDVDVFAPFIHSRQELPCNSRNLSTIYETDEKNVNKESEANISRMAASKSCSSTRSRSASPKNKISVQIGSKSRIPIRIRSYSSGAIFTEKANNLKPLPKSSTLCATSFVCCRKNSESSEEESSRLSLRSRPSKIPLQSSTSLSGFCVNKKQPKTQPQRIDMATSTNDITKDLVARVHPKACNRQIYTKPSVTSDKQQQSNDKQTSVELQRALDGTSNLELPITFEIVKPKNNANRNIGLERNVMSYDTASLGVSYGIKDNRNELKCFKTENVNAWPLLQKKFETANKALFVSTHCSHHNNLEQVKSGDFESQMKILQQHPSNKNLAQEATCPNVPQRIPKPKRLTRENFTIVGITSERILRRPATIASDRSRSSRCKKRIKNARPEVIDIKVAKNIKSTKLKHRFFKDGQRPGYVTVLSTPCNCPDITIFLPCCCGCYDGGDSSLKRSFSRKTTHYAMMPMIPIVQKDQTK